ncbi:MAG: dockerin type I domain-containing protein [Clostridium sp.]
MKKNLKKEGRATALALSTIMLLGIAPPISSSAEEKDYNKNYTSAFTLGNRSISGLAAMAEDINSDGKVDILDLSQIASLYNVKQGSNLYKPQYDLTSDGIIDIYDIIKVARKLEGSKDTAAPAEFQISKDNWDGSPNFKISMNLWFGANGDLWRLYENDVLVAEIPLVNSTPNAQAAFYEFKDKPNGTYVYTSELVNSVGTTQAKASVTHEVTKNDKPIEVPLPESASGEPAVGYTVLRETKDMIEWGVFIANPNKNYIWEGKDFSAWGLSFDTDNEVTYVSNCGKFTQEGKKVTIELKQDERLLPYQTTKVFTVRANKKTANAPTNFKPNLFRGNLTYPKFSGLPSSWSKNKADLSVKDLIANPQEYYNTTVTNKTGNMLMYNNPAHKTQLQLGLPKKMPTPVNGVKDLRIWIPSEYLAMGLGTGTEFFGLNPNFMVGLSIKENFTCGLVPVESGYNENITEYDGQTWSWPIQKLHADGPFQQEKGNFNEVKKQYPDYLPDTAEHQNYVTLKNGNPDDPSYVNATISSYISLTMTREFLYAIPANKFDEFVRDANDKWAEYVLVDNAYNRGVYGLLQRNLFTTHREQALKTTDLNEEFDLGGFASHIETIKSIIIAMDNETSEIYDAKLTWDMFEKYFDQLRLFYGRGVPSDGEWTAMKADVKKAFDVLSKHWGDNTVSYRYDFLTLLRVAQQYLPENKQPAPSSASWIEQIVSANNQALTAPPK